MSASTFSANSTWIDFHNATLYFLVSPSLNPAALRTRRERDGEVVATLARYAHLTIEKRYTRRTHTHTWVRFFNLCVYHLPATSFPPSPPHAQTHPHFLSQHASRMPSRHPSCHPFSIRHPSVPLRRLRMNRIESNRIERIRTISPQVRAADSVLADTHHVCGIVRTPPGGLVIILRQRGRRRRRRRWRRRQRR